VWLPVFSARNSKALWARTFRLNVRDDGISIVVDGHLVPEMVDILKIVKDYDMVLATGHISPPEILAAIDKAKQVGVAKIIVTHAMFDFISESVLKPEERKMLAREEGVFIEHTALEISPTLGRKIDPLDIAAAIKNEGPRNCVMSTDFGHIAHPTVAEGMRMFVSTMLKCGLSEEEITHMAKLNPAKLLLS